MPLEGDRYVWTLDRIIRGWRAGAFMPVWSKCQRCGVKFQRYVMAGAAPGVMCEACEIGPHEQLLLPRAP